MRFARLVTPILLLSLTVGAADLPRASEAAIKAHATFLADDVLQGRDTGTEGFEIAARYAAAQFQQYGLVPAGDDGTYFQTVKFLENRLDGASLEISKGDKSVKLVLRDDYYAFARQAEKFGKVDAEAVFVGFGVDAPQLGHQDYKNIDVRGKIVVAFHGAPASFPTDERAHFSGTGLKMEEAAKRGAIGLLRIRSRLDNARVPWERYLGFADGPTHRWIEPDGSVHKGMPTLRFSGIMSSEGARKFMKVLGESYDDLLQQAEDLSYRTRRLPIRIKGTTRSFHTKISSPNVAAMIEGSDPELRNEYIVCTAHLDHVGLGKAFDGDAIYNGFYDNAMGSSLIIELARILSSAETRPARSIIFLLVTGEEVGLLGSDYFAHYPTVDKKAVVANVNIDMPLLLHDVSDIIAYGAEHTTIGEAVRTVAAKYDFEITPDPTPAEVIFVRSDQYSFVKQGVPAIYLDPGPGSRDGSDGEAIVRDFRKNHYHLPSDDTSRKVHWESALRFAQMNAELTMMIANAPEKPRWHKNDFFGLMFDGYGAR